MSRLLFAAAGMVALLAPAAPAWAHGRFPNPTEIHFHPSDPNVVLLQTSRGLVGTTDGGTSWEWLCYEVVGEATFGEDDPAMVLLDDSSALVASGGSGVTMLEPSWCDSTTAPPDPGTDYFIIDVALNGNRALALTSSGPPTVNRLYESTDGGDSWTATSSGIAAAFLESVAVAPSNPNVLYIGGVRDDPVTSERQGVLYRSDDGGATWTAPTVLAIDADEKRPVIAGIDPTDPSRVFVLVEHRDGVLEPPPERLLLSEDSGATVTQVHEVASAGGFAISADGSTAWIGDDLDGGLWRSDDGGSTFSSVDAAIEVNCLQYHDAQLWICANDFVDGFAIGTSTDGGESFTPHFRFSDITGVRDCPAGTLGATVCEQAKCNALTELGVDLQSVAPECPTPDAGTPGGDGGSTGGGGGDGGCALAQPGTGAGNDRPALPWLLVAAGVTLLRRRRS